MSISKISEIEEMSLEGNGDESDKQAGEGRYSCLKILWKQSFY